MKYPENASSREWAEASLYTQSVIACNLLWLIATGVFRLYSEATILKQQSFYRSTWKSITLQGLLFLTYFVFSFNINVAGNFLVYSYITLGFGFLMSRFTGGHLIQLSAQDKTLSKGGAIIGIDGGLKHSSKHKAA